jgi:hypothetical protein
LRLLIRGNQPFAAQRNIERQTLPQFDLRHQQINRITRVHAQTVQNSFGITVSLFRNSGPQEYRSAFHDTKMLNNAQKSSDKALKEELTAMLCEH